MPRLVMPNWSVVWPGVVLAVPVLTALAYLYSTPINAEVHSVIGGIRTYNDSPLGAFDVFSYRPLPYRLLIGLMHSAASLIGEPGTLRYEFVVRTCGVAISAGAGASLGFGLRRYMPSTEALAAGAAAAIGLGLAPMIDFLPPEWVSAAAVVAAVGTALWARSTAAAGAIGGFFIVLAFAVKLATAPLSLLALLAILIVDRKRAAAAFVGSIGWGLVWLAMLILVPLERQWTLDMAGFAGNAPWRVGVDAEFLNFMGQTIASKAIIAPVILLAPAAALTLALLAPPGRRAGVLGVIALGLVLAMAPLVVQGTHNLYQLAMLPVASAVLVGLAFARALRHGSAEGWVLGPALVVASIGCGLALNLDPVTREASVGLVLALASIVAIACAVAVVLLGRLALAAPGRRMVAVVLASAALAGAMLPALLPAAGWSFDPGILTRTNGDWVAMVRSKRANAAAVTAVIGNDTPVLYLATGSVAYYMGNPTTCRYAIPWFLRVGTHLRFARDFQTYHDNLACISETDADFVVIEPGWLWNGPLTSEIRGRLRVRYNCANGVAIEFGPTFACPRLGD